MNKFSDLNYKDVVFKECPTHTMLRYAGDACPVCKLVKDHDLALGRAEYDKTQLEGTIADLEQHVRELRG